MRQTLPLLFSAVALGVAVLDTTPLGEAAATVAVQIVPRNSVGPQQLQRNAVGSKNIAPNAVRAGHVLDGSLLAADFKPGQLPQGPKGDHGDKGDRGERGEKGASGATNAVVRRQNWSGGNGGRVSCANGEVATGGGFYGGGTPFLSRPTPATEGAVPKGWEAFFVPTSGTGSVYAICVSP